MTKEKRKNRKELGPDPRFTPYWIGLMARYAFTRSAVVREAGLRALWTLLKTSDLEKYEKWEDRALLLAATRAACRQVLSKGVRKKRLLYEAVCAAVQGSRRHLEEVLGQGDVSEEEARSVDEYLSHRLQHLELYRSAPSLLDLLTRLQAGDTGEDPSEFTAELLELLESTGRAGRLAGGAGGSPEQDFHGAGDDLRRAVREAAGEMQAPSALIRTGVQYLNDMLNGGFESGRTYMFLGLPGGFKSGTLLNACVWALDSGINGHVRAKDPTKVPVVLYVTQENSRNETLDRLYGLANGCTASLRDAEDPDEAADVIEGLLAPPDSRVRLEVKYRANRSIRVADLDTMIDELASEGKEVVMLVHDYVKRIKSNEKFEEVRHELGAVVNDFSTLAKARKIPVVTASQLNREAYRVIEEASNRSGGGDAARRVGASHIGESTLMVENLDWGAVIHREETSSSVEGGGYDKRTWLTFKLIKQRGKSPERVYFAHPFSTELRIQTDTDQRRPASVTELADGLRDARPQSREPEKVPDRPTRGRSRLISDDDE